MKKQTEMKLKFNPKTLLIVMSIAFLISLGFICWQNFVYQQATTDTVGSGMSTSDSKSTTVKQTRYLTLDNWNVRVPLKDNSYYYSSGDYTTINADDQIYALSTRSLRVACGRDDATIGSIERVLNSGNNESKIGASNVKGTKVLGKYLYIFTSPHSNCNASTEVIRLQENATKEFIPLLGSLQEMS